MGDSFQTFMFNLNTNDLIGLREAVELDGQVLKENDGVDPRVFYNDYNPKESDSPVNTLGDMVKSQKQARVRRWRVPEGRWSSSSR